MTLYIHVMILTVTLAVLMRTSSSLHVDSCAAERDCSQQAGDLYLNCTVSHMDGYLAAKQLMKETRGLSHDLKRLPYLSALEIYDRPYSSRTVESLRFQIRLPVTDIGVSPGQLSGLLVEFSEEETASQNHLYHHTDPICRFFNFSESSLTREQVDSSKMKVTYDCIGIDIIPSTFVLSLQTLPASLPLVYVISWTEATEIADYYSLESMMWESVWTHRVVAVAKVAPPSPGSDQNVPPPSPRPDHKVPPPSPGSDHKVAPPSLVLPGHTSLHVVFQPGREAVTFYRITLITNSSREDTPSKLLQASKDPNEVMFHNVKPGSYKVKVEALGEICYYQHCPPILSADINVKFQDLIHSSLNGNEPRLEPNDSFLPQSTSLNDTPPGLVARSSSRHGIKLLPEIGALVVLALAVGVFAALCIYLIHLKITRSRRQKMKRGHQLTIHVTSLADRSLERQISNHFAKFLTQTLDAIVNLTLPYIQPQGDPETHVCLTPTGSDEPLLNNSVWKKHNKDIPASDTAMLYVVLDFFYGVQDCEGLGAESALSIEQRREYPTKNWSRLCAEMRQAVAKTDQQNVLCVTFAHQIAPSIAYSSKTSQCEEDEALSCWTEGTRSHTIYSDIPVSVVRKSADDTMSRVNRFESDDCQAGISGVAQFFLPADRHRLYADLSRRAKRPGCTASESLLDSEYSKSLSNALEVFRKASEQHSYTEASPEPLTRTCSIETVAENIFLGASRRN